MHFHIHIRTNSDVEIGEDVTSAVRARQRRLDKIGKHLEQEYVDYYEPSEDVDVADTAGQTSLLAYVNEIAQSMVR
jgi:hypothetical protein